MNEALQPIRLDGGTPLRELVFEALREAIIAGDLPPGERLMEVPLAEVLGVSRTPVREAIRMLELEGFVMLIPRKGAYVADMSVQDAASVFEIRAALEGLAAELAAERASAAHVERLERMLVECARCVEKNDVEAFVELDTQFHAVIYEASRNERLVPLLSLLREQIQRFRARTLAYPGRLRLALEEHRAMVEAIASRDTELARRCASEHIESAENIMLTLVKSNEAKGRERNRD